MNEQAARYHQLVPVHHHQFRISDETGPVGPDVPREHNGLVEVQDGIATVLTGIHTGDVDVTVTFHADAPRPVDAAWEEIVEVSLHSVSGGLMVRGLMADLDEELPALSFDGPDTYRLRIHARGRDAAVDLAPDGITEWYLIQVWPAPVRQAAVLRRTDNHGVSVRAH
ncbi:hypothetical protein ACF1BE_32925 [Streptomyces sp. NPDC014991]|uniref:hypothetical protein n=1 Tax=Streptomyces sp. NPDC014991 TaxID=3364935 RepID=UPI0036FD1EDB